MSIPKIILSSLALIVIAVGAWMAFRIFIPDTYNVRQLQKRAGTKYWQLPTGSTIAYTLVPAKGTRKPYPIVYLHGGPGAGITDLEIKVLGQLAEHGYDVYLYDQVGCGHSGRLDNIMHYTAERHLRDLEQVVNKIGADKIILLGQSWGAILSVLYVAENSSRVHRLVITAPATIQPENKSYGSIPVPDSLTLKPPAYNVNYKTSIRTRANEFWMRKFKKKLAGDQEADNFATYFVNDLNRQMVCDTANAVDAEGTEGYYVHYMTRLSMGKIKDPRPQLLQCDLPVLVMKAQCDNQRWGYTTEYLELFRNHKFVLIRNAGHNIFIEQPDVYLQTISDFLKR